MAEVPIRLTSVQNPHIKNIVRLNNRHRREAVRLTIVEGQREVNRALKAGVVPQEAYVCPELLDGADAKKTYAKLQLLAQAGETKLFEVTLAVFEKMAYRGRSGGLLLVIPYLEHALAELEGLAMPFLVVIDGAEKPGNLGAILRTADAAGVDGLLLTVDTNSGTDIYNPNTIRASLGAVFTVPVHAQGIAETITWLRNNGIKIVAATPEAEELFTDVSMTGPIAVVLGSEAYGLSKAWLEAADQQVGIPMFGEVDSLNLSVSTALLLYEVVRQRGAEAGGIGPLEALTNSA
jgi:TrmH family RNA methyltransferase